MPRSQQFCAENGTYPEGEFTPSLDACSDLSGRTHFIADALGNVVLMADTASSTVKKTLSNICDGNCA